MLAALCRRRVDRSMRVAVAAGRAAVVVAHWWPMQALPCDPEVARMSDILRGPALVQELELFQACHLSTDTSMAPLCCSLHAWRHGRSLLLQLRRRALLPSSFCSSCSCASSSHAHNGRTHTRSHLNSDCEGKNSSACKWHLHVQLTPKMDAGPLEEASEHSLLFCQLLATPLAVAQPRSPRPRHHCWHSSMQAAGMRL